MEFCNQEYQLTLLRTPQGVLRIPISLSRALGNHDHVSIRIKDQDGKCYPAKINVRDRTLFGIGNWINTLKDDQINSITLRIEKNDPWEGSIWPSKDYVEPSGQQNLQKPERGLYLGEYLESDFLELKPTGRSIAFDETDLVRHAFICGVTGAGKTVLGKVIIEEISEKGVPCIVIDLKGDLSSLGLFLSGEDPEEFFQLVSPRFDESREHLAVKEAERHRRNLERWGLGERDVDNIRKKVVVNVFTPKSNAGFRLALSAFVRPPVDLQTMKQEDPDAYVEVIQFLSETFVSRLNLNRKKSDKAKAYIYEIIKTFWDRGISLEGYQGLKRLLDEVRLNDHEIDQIGGMPTEEYISSKDREDISVAINNLLSGTAKLWFQGFPAEIQALIDHKEYANKTPISIINIQHLGFQDQSYVVGYIAYLIWFWMRRQQGTERPRLVFYIDEIGGGGGKQALFPSVANSPAKPALNLLLRQGRSQGVCCLFATQNPGDIDYKGLSNCGTWAVGQLRTNRDISKIEQGAGLADLDFQAAKTFIPTLSPGQFVITSPSEKWKVIHERWLYGHHRVLTHDELKILKIKYEQEAQELLQMAEEKHSGGSVDYALEILEKLVTIHRFSSSCSRAYLMMGKLYFDVQKYEKAIESLKLIFEKFLDAEEAGEAQLLIGKCFEKQGHFEAALKSFEEVSYTSANDRVRQQAYLHREFCRSHIIWPKLSTLKKAILWILGQKPEEQPLAKIEIKDDEILTEAIKPLLPIEEFSIPEPVDYEILLRIKEEITAEMLQLERWSQEQGRKIEEYIKAGQLSEAYHLAQRIIQRLVDSGCRAPDSVYNTLRLYNESRAQAKERILSRIISFQARQFEYEVANWMTWAGYQAQVTQQSHDDGVDVLATRNGEKIVIQCKRWRGLVGPDKVRELAGARGYWNADRALLVTTSDFTDSAKSTAQSLNIELWNFEVLTQKLRTSN